MIEKIIVICGPTASGKSAYAIERAKELEGIILNGDSMQVYKDIPILTAQPSREDLKQVPHEFYGFVKCDQDFSVGNWLELIVPRIKEIFSIGKTPIVVGGTGLYLKSLIDGFVEIPSLSSATKAWVAALDEEKSSESLHSMLESRDTLSYQKLKINDRRRILRALAVFYETNIPIGNWQKNNHKTFFAREQFSVTLINPARDIIYRNCDIRFLKMLEGGAAEEVKQLMQRYPNHKYPPALGLKEIMAYLNNDLSKEAMIKKVQQLTRNYAKRQTTWFKHQMQYEVIYDGS